MKKRISKTIFGKKFNKESLLYIIDEIYKNYENSDSDHKTFSITLHCANYETLEFRDVNFSEKHNEILDIKKIHQIKIYYIDYRNDKNISLTLSEGDSNYDNNLGIEGNDIDWVNASEKKLDELFQVVESRKNYFKKYSRLIFHFSALNIGSLALRMFVSLLEKFEYAANTTNDNDNPLSFLLVKFVEIFPPLKYLFVFLASWFIGLLIIVWFYDKVEKLFSYVFPSIEFDFGPVHMRKPRKIRKVIATIFSLIILPIILQIIFSL